jgi:hypothetical protein
MEKWKEDVGTTAFWILMARLTDFDGSEFTFEE